MKNIKTFEKLLDYVNRWHAAPDVDRWHAPPVSKDRASVEAYTRAKEHIARVTKAIRTKYGDIRDGWRPSFSWKDPEQILECGLLQLVFPKGNNYPPDDRVYGEKPGPAPENTDDAAVKELNGVLDNFKGATKESSQSTPEKNLRAFLIDFGRIGDTIDTITKEDILKQAILVLKDLMVEMSLKFKPGASDTRFLGEDLQVLFVSTEEKQFSPAMDLLIQLRSSKDKQMRTAYNLLNPLVRWAESLFHAGLGDLGKLNGLLAALDRNTFVHFSSLVQAMINMAQLGKLLFEQGQTKK